MGGGKGGFCALLILYMSNTNLMKEIAFSFHHHFPAINDIYSLGQIVH